MRHRKSGRKLGRNQSHRNSMFRNMATSLICSSKPDAASGNAPKVPGRIITTVEKAKELRPVVEKLITMGKKALAHQDAAAQFATSAARGSAEWEEWRKSDRWQKWNAAIAPAVSLRRRAFAALRSKEAVAILFSEIAPRFRERQGGYTRVVRLAEFRLGDAGRKALIEFVGQNDRKSVRRGGAARSIATT
ncbi:bL17 family ribosomal protein [Schlesneria sp. T3-172]|uniref:bL17 family ribosomal protein n=1 Tax=Schlesneria TaxID=656899 RepID=UPI002F2319CF